MTICVCWFSVANKCCAHLWKVKELERSAWVSASESERIVYEKDGFLVSDYKLKALKRCKFQQTWAIKALTSGCSSTSQWYFYHSDFILSLTLDFNHWVSNNPPCHLLHPFSLISHHLRSNGDYSKNRKRSKFLFPDVEKKTLQAMVVLKLFCSLIFHFIIPQVVSSPVRWPSALPGATASSTWAASRATAARAHGDLVSAPPELRPGSGAQKLSLNRVIYERRTRTTKT